MGRVVIQRKLLAKLREPFQPRSPNLFGAMERRDRLIDHAHHAHQTAQYYQILPISDIPSIGMSIAEGVCSPKL